MKRENIEEEISFWDNPKVKPRVIFIKDNTELNEDFKEDAEFELFMEQETHYIIYHQEVFYGTYKSNCRKEER